MNIGGLLASLEASRIADAIRNSLYIFPLIEAVHVIGLAMVFGTIAIVDLRLLGVASTRRPFSRLAADTLKWTWWAFALTALTGLLMFATNATVYAQNFYFRTKMVLLALSGLNMLMFELTARRSVQRWDEDRAAPPAGRAVAVVSLLLWISIIFAGRWIGFTTTGRPPAANEEPNIDIESLMPK